jgi:hypothetical protein
MVNCTNKKRECPYGYKKCCIECDLRSKSTDCECTENIQSCGYFEED